MFAQTQPGGQGVSTRNGTCHMWRPAAWRSPRRWVQAVPLWFARAGWTRSLEQSKVLKPHNQVP